MSINGLFNYRTKIYKRQGYSYLELNSKLELKLEQPVLALNEEINNNAAKCENKGKFLIKEKNERAAKTQVSFNKVEEKINSLEAKVVGNDVENKEQIQQLLYKVEDCKIKYSACTYTMLRLQDKTLTFENTTKQLKDKVIHGVNIPSVSLSQIPGSVENIPTFSGYYKDNPMTFMRTIKTYMTGISDEISRLHFIRGCLKDYPRQWYDMIIDEVMNFKDFETRFIRQYWG